MSNMLKMQEIIIGKPRIVGAEPTGKCTEYSATVAVESSAI